MVFLTERIKQNMVQYVKCPRCDLNYINEEKQEYCDVCIAELKGNKLQFADLEDDVYDELDIENETNDLCPNCGVNRLHYGESVCEVCRKANKYGDEEEDVDIEQDEEWKTYLDEDENADLTVDDETLEEELKEAIEEEEEAESEDDFFDDDPLSDLEDDDFNDAFDEEDDEDDDEEDEDDDF